MLDNLDEDAGMHAVVFDQALAELEDLHGYSDE
jgi:hypothetical protein